MPDASPDRPLADHPAHRPRRRRPGVAVALAVTILVAGAACTATTTDPAASSTTASPDTSAATGASTYGSIAALHDAVVDAGFACTLEYPGLRDDVTANEVSICTIEDETAYLTVWGDPAKLAEFAASTDGSTGTVALGADWSISVTTPALATELAAALGGTAPAS